MSEPTPLPTDGATNPGAATPPSEPAGPFAGWLNPDGTFRENHADSLPDDIKDYGATLKNFRTMPEVVKELHRLTRAIDGAVKVPGEKATKEEIAAFRKAIGAAEKPEDYALGEGSESVAKWAAENGVPKSAVQKLAELRKAEAEAQTKAAQEEDAKTIATEREVLAKVWGKDMEKNAKQALEAAKLLGVNLDEYADAKLAQAFKQIGEWFQSDPGMLKGKGIPDGLFSMVAPNPRSQAIDIIQNPQNPDYARYHSGERSVVRKVQDLMARGV
jgi:hypothetical protein